MRHTVETLRMALDAVKQHAAKDDHEAAHAAEDYLMRAALMAIANVPLTRQQCAEVAEIALAAREIEFHRWCA